MRSRVLIVLAALVASVLLAPLPAQAAARVTVSNDQGEAAVDPKYGTTISVSGKGFQSIKGGHGGIYVFFGTVDGQWRPSKGGQTGRNMFYVPDSESRNNQGFQRFVAFPGSDTAGAANGGEIKANGTWKAQMTVPGATFDAVDRDGKAKAVNCLKVTCGIITIGAHGVKNSTNETFTPVSFENLYEGEQAPAAAAVEPTAAAPEAAVAEDEAAEDDADAPAAEPTLTVDQGTAVAGRVLSFNATGLPQGDQVVVTLDDGVAAVGPLSVGPNGQVAGTLQLPADLSAGTHELRMTGTESAPTITFPVSSDVELVASDEESTTPWLPIGFAIGAAFLLVLALTFSIVRVRSQRKKATHAV